jgi:uncharacterized delta-60 repeat protein
MKHAKTASVLLALLAFVIPSLAGASEVAARAGALDPTWGKGGRVTTAFGPIQAQVDSLAIQRDGRVVAAGYSVVDPDHSVLAVARYRPSGKLDPTFGMGGRVTTRIGSNFDFGHAVAVQQDGKIVVAGTTLTQLDPVRRSIVLVRYRSDGTPDLGFGQGGIVTTAIGLDSFAGALVVQPDGRLVVAGDSLRGSHYEFALARYTTSGQLDPSFGDGGIAETQINGGNSAAETLALQPDGKLVAAGSTWTDEQVLPPGLFAVARYQTDGSLDRGFGVDGTVVTAVGPVGVDDASSVAIQPDGKIVAAGSSNDGTADSFALVRYESGGELDPSFGVGGKVTTSLSAADDWISAIAVRPNGKIVAVGTAGHETRLGAVPEFAVARYREDGSLDRSFGSAGKRIFSFGPDDDEANAVAIQQNGRIIVGGLSDTCACARGKWVFALARLLATASPSRR